MSYVKRVQENPHIYTQVPF